MSTRRQGTEIIGMLQPERPKSVGTFDCVTGPCFTRHTSRCFTVKLSGACRKKCHRIVKKAFNINLKSEFWITCKLQCNKTDLSGMMKEQSVLCNCRPINSFLNTPLSLTRWQRNKTSAFFHINWVCFILGSFFLLKEAKLFTCWTSCKEMD